MLGGRLEFESLGIHQIRAGLSEGQFTCSDLVDHYLSKTSEGAPLNAFISVFGREQLRERAEQIDAKVGERGLGKLAGTVIALKDNLILKGHATTCASHILDNFIPPYDATIVEKLLAEDAIIIGKTNMDEFAMGSSSENSYFGPVRNPHDPDHVPGGSSGGSCAAVAAGMATVALGSDTGGSIRQPASFCGVVGLKPTYGRVSRFGLVAFASSFDQIGPITKTVEDAALLLEVLAGGDRKDSTCADVPVPAYVENCGQEVSGLKIGLPTEYFTEGLHVDVRASLDKTVALLKEQGAEFVDVSLPHTDYAISAYYILTTAEASSNLSRYDGVRYGLRASDVTSLEEMYVKTRTEGFGAEVKRRIMLGTYVLSSGYYDAYYRKAQKVRTLIARDFEQAFERCDAVLTPTAPTTAFKLGEKLDNPLEMYLSDVYTVSVNLAGLPGLSVPCGVDSRGLPVGVQLIGKHFEEGLLLKIGSMIERCRSTAENETA